MSTKPSPDALKMLHLIDDYFNGLFKNNKYSDLFQREFRHLFKIERASAFSVFGNDAYIVGLGLIDCWDFDKNIGVIETKVNETLQRNQEIIAHLKNLTPVVKKEIRDGRLDKDCWEIFNDKLKEVKKWEESIDEPYTYLPFFLRKLNGNIKDDYQIIVDEFKRDLNWKKDYDRVSVLYQQLCKWIDDDRTKAQYGKRRWEAMKEKFAFMNEKWFSLKDDFDFEKSKQLISEVFYPDQEEYYKKLEEWAKTEIDDKSCASWIKDFLCTGRTLPIRQVQVLRFKGNLEMGKTFLLSKYEEKLKWDEKKKHDREYAHKSLFDSFDEKYNSFQPIWTNFENKYSLFPQCICANVDSNRFPKLSMFGDWTDGIKIQHDTIHYGIIVENMTLESTNRYFFIYRSKYKKSRIKIIIYSDRGFELIKDYLTHTMPTMEINDNIIGCMSIVDTTSTSSPVGISSLLSYTKDNYDPNPKVISHYEKSGLTLSQKGFQNTLGLRLFTNAAIFQIAKRIGYSITLTLEKTLSDDELSSLMQHIDKDIDKLTFEERYLCHFINYAQYKFPKEGDELFKKFNLSRRINLYHNVQEHYSTPIFCEWLFPFAKIVHEYKNTEFKKNTDSVGSDFYRYRYNLSSWFDKTNQHFLFNLRVLCYLNWVFISSKTGNIKKLSALWLFYILYSCKLGAYRKDCAFLDSLLYYTCIQNEKIFIKLLEHIKGTYSGRLWKKYDVNTILFNVIRLYSNDFKGWGKVLTYNQREYLNGGKWKHDLLVLYQKNRKDMKIIDNEETSKLASEIFNQISTKIENDHYPHSNILAIFEDMEPFNLPDNFTYRQRQSNNCLEYNADYSGSYAHDVMGYSNDEIDTIFDGDPNAYWNID
ncbi:MAG: hypothetical protein HDS89_08695 [Bacteroidales bacterium]|nr:hypothetical protein [Bacteroidales bacterium]